MTNRAYSILTVKAVGEDERVITGIATTPNADRVGDVVEPLGMSFKNPMPLLHQHDHRNPVGTVVFDKPTKDGIKFTATLPKILEPGPLKDRVDTAWGEIKAGIVRAVSIGFRPIKHAYREDGGIDFQEVEIYELSTVSVPANAQAVISAIKSLDKAAMAKAGVDPQDFVVEPEGDAASVQQEQEPAASGTKGLPVVKLNDTARVGAKPFVVNKINT